MDDPDAVDRADAERRDAADPLAGFRDRFATPDGERYMDGNSLGLAPAAAEASVERVVDEWRDLAIRGWEAADPDWFSYAEQLSDRLAPLVGAREGEVAVANSTTVNVHTLVGSFLDQLPGTPAGSDPAGEAPAVVVNELDFPTDHYAVRAQLRQRGIDPEGKLAVVESRDGRTVRAADVEATLDERDDAGIVFMPSVLYRSGQLLDVERIAAAAHEAGALAGFDCAHSVGVVDHDLHGAGVDFAVWCSYKYLNAGPGATAGLYVHERHHDVTPALAGWWGHEKATQFEMRGEYTPAADAGRWQVGTPPLLSTAPLSGALDVLEEAGVDRVRRKSVALTDYLIDLVDERLPDAFAVGTPRDPDRRGGHVAVEHPDGYRLSEALRDRGVVVDFRPPNVVRVCPSPLYTRFVDVWDVVETVRKVVETDAHLDYETRGGGVT
ncbi:kynureninase [Candidatus Halobonum tyrrellensis]|uniref:Kynureninase n=1 Tax=Candidatus Halobonum tyrrellensis G22 TaxID=1324957 RepID=V4GSG0_9EURY|nr:kynureninase [Candidatus Halobonum tyrrellensis]ESP88031.1 kynureninase [Candidatus Halobonum tyrrellensis G22]